MRQKHFAQALSIAALLIFVLGIASISAAADEKATAAPQMKDGQYLFETPEQALSAFKDAAGSKDPKAQDAVLGPAYSEIANPDPVQRENERVALGKKIDEGIKLSKQDENTYNIVIGNEEWPFPIPLVRKDDRWMFDTRAGKEEILNRRIGQNELAAIDVCLAYVKAQRDYAVKDADGNGIMEYARRFRSTAGHRDGLYWPSVNGEDESPFGPLVAAAQAEGYWTGAARTAAAKESEKEVKKEAKEQKKAEGESEEQKVRARRPFHGYDLRILTKQGKHAPGGAYDYVINDHMVAGFALVAYPAAWGNSGVMTFVVNQQGKIYQKNLGEKTAEVAAKIDEYDPDDTWTPAEPRRAAPAQAETR